MDKSTAAVALATAALVPAVYAVALPSMADVRGQHDDSGHLVACERYAALVAGAMVLGVGAVTRSPAALAAGGIALVGFSAAYRHATQAQP